jgi:sialic acid synthase SpsE
MEQMIKTAAEIGVDIIKWQSFKADRLNKSWPDYQKAYEYYKSVELSDDDHVFILDKCKECGIEPLFTAFDVERAGYLKSIGLNTIKIGSAEASDYDFIMKCRSILRGPGTLIISTGMIDIPKVLKLKQMRAINLLNCSDKHVYMQLFYCISKYPTKYEEIDFDKMQLFDGFSDHTADLRAAKKAIDLNMGIIERHFTLGKWLPGNDHKISSTPDEFRELVGHRDYKVKCDLYKRRWSNA